MAHRSGLGGAGDVPDRRRHSAIAHPGHPGTDEVGTQRRIRNLVSVAKLVVVRLNDYWIPGSS